MDVSVIGVVGLTNYALLGIMSIALLFFLIRSLIALTIFIQILSDYWRMKARAQYQAMHEEPEID